MDKKQIFEPLEKLSKLHKALIICGLFLVTGAAYWFFILDPQLTEKGQLESEINSLNKSITSYRKQLKRLPALKKELAAKEREFVLAKNLLPEDAQALENLLASFEVLGKEQGLEFLYFQPGAETQHEFYAAREVSLKLQGQFHDLMIFFDKLSHLRRLVTLQSIRFQPGSKSGLIVSLTADSSLLVYRALTQQEIEAAKNAKKKKKGRR